MSRKEIVQTAFDKALIQVEYPSVYLAGTMATDWREIVAPILAGGGFRILRPEDNDQTSPMAYVPGDVKMCRECDVWFGYWSPGVKSRGVYIELGIAMENHRPVWAAWAEEPDRPVYQWVATAAYRLFVGPNSAVEAAKNLAAWLQQVKAANGAIPAGGSNA